MFLKASKRTKIFIFFIIPIFFLTSFLYTNATFFNINSRGLANIEKVNVKVKPSNVESYQKLVNEINAVLNQSIKVENSKYRPLALGFIDYDYTVNPYFVNLALTTILKIPKTHISDSILEKRKLVVFQWFNWYLNHLVKLPHTQIYNVYDYKLIKNGNKFNQMRMDHYNKINKSNLPLFDSVDSYLATFLSFSKFLHDTYPREFEEAFAKEYEKFNYILSSLFILSKLNSFTQVIPGNDTYYLMDNLEVYLGLKDFCQLFKKVETVNKNFIKVKTNAHRACVNSKALSIRIPMNFEKKKSSFESELFVALQGQKQSEKFEGSSESIYPYYMAQFFPFMNSMTTSTPATSSTISVFNKAHIQALQNLSRSQILTKWYSLNHNSSDSNFDPYPHFWLFKVLNSNKFDLNKFYNFYIIQHQRKYYYNINEAQHLIKALYIDSFKKGL